MNPRETESRRVLTVSTPAGDRKLFWAPDNKSEVGAAREEFDRLRAEGYIAYHTTPEGALQGLMREFDPLIDAITIVPPILGG